MKRALLGLFLLGVSLTGCDSEESAHTKNLLFTDKDEYRAGDTVRLTMKMLTNESGRKIRLYENYKNLEVSFSLVNESQGVLNDMWSPNSGQTLPVTSEKAIRVTKEHPFEKTFTGVILADEATVTLDFAELNLKASFDKRRIQKDSVRVHGFYNPIKEKFGDSSEEYFEVKDFKINVDG